MLQVNLITFNFADRASWTSIFILQYKTVLLWYSRQCVKLLWVYCTLQEIYFILNYTLVLLQIGLIAFITSFVRKIYISSLFLEKYTNNFYSSLLRMYIVSSYFSSRHYLAAISVKTIEKLILIGNYCMHFKLRVHNNIFNRGMQKFQFFQISALPRVLALCRAAALLISTSRRRRDIGGTRFPWQRNGSL